MAASSSSSSIATTTCHLIDGDGTFCENPELIEHLAAAVVAPVNEGGNATATPAQPRQLLKQVGCQYRVVGVFGGQSTGKSTLLNALFGCRFAVMDAAKGRSQTTKGAFLAAAKEASSEFLSEDAAPPPSTGSAVIRGRPQAMYVVDFEGTDGMERGEDQHFERQLSLFALSVADVLIINMWAHEVGRFNAANLSLLRTVFEVNLHLFDRSAESTEGSSSVAAPKPTLLFVLRDHTSPNVDASIDVVLKGLAKVWEGVSKPAALANSGISDLFHLRFMALPHYELQRPEFEAAVGQLRHWFFQPDKLVTPKPPLFEGDATFRGIPLEGLPSYLKSCWQSIVRHKDLDIPSQRDMLARIRCSELTASLKDRFQVDVEERLASIRQGVRLRGLAGQIKKLIATADAEFASETTLYSKMVTAEARASLLAALTTTAAALVDAQDRFIAEALMKSHGEQRVQNAIDHALNNVVVSSAKDWFVAPKGAASDGTPTSVRLATRQVVLKFWNYLSGEVDATAQAIKHDLEVAMKEPTVGTDNEAAVPSDRPLTVAVAASLLHDDEDVSAQSSRVASVVRGILNLAAKRVHLRFCQLMSDANHSMVKVFERALHYGPDGAKRPFATVKGLQAAFGPARAAGFVFLAAAFVNRLRLETADGNRLAAVDFLSAEDFFLVYDATISKMGDVTSVEIREPPTYPRLPELPQTPADETASALNRDTVLDVVLGDGATIRRGFDLYQQHCDFTLAMMIKTIESGQQPVPMYMWLLLLVLGANEVYWVLTNPLLLLIGVVVIYVFFRQFVVDQWQKFEETGPPMLVLPAKAALNKGRLLFDTHVAPLLGMTTAVAPTKKGN